MTVTIDGTTGVSLVQDGVVTSAKIADGAVAAADLASTLDLTGKTVTLPAGTGGKILQVLSMSTTTEYSTGSTSYTATGLTLDITPSSTSSKIYAAFSSAGFCNTNGFIALTLYRDSTNLGNGTYGLTWAKDYTTNFIDSVSFQYLDSPATTSQVTYTVRQRAQEAGHSVTTNINNTRGVLTLMEIAG